MLDYLPLDIFVRLMEGLAFQDVCNVSMTCSLLSKFGSNDAIWYTMIYQDFINDESTSAFKYFLHNFSEKCGWKICYRVLYMMRTKSHPNFWDDANDVIDLDIGTDNLRHVSLAGAAKLVIDDHLKHYQDKWLLNVHSLSILSQIIASEPKIPFKHLINTLLQAAEGPHETTSNIYYRINSLMIAQFARFKHESLRHLCVSQYQEDAQELFLLNLSPSTCMSHQDIFDASTSRVQIAVLRIIVTIFNHCGLEKNDRLHIENIIKRSIGKDVWTLETEYLRGWICFLCKFEESESLTSDVDFFDFSVDPWTVAMQMTVKQHVKLSNLKLNSYLEDTIHNMGRSIDDLTRHRKRVKRNINARKLQNSENLPQFLVKHFSRMGNKKLKIYCVKRLILVAHSLLDLNNYFSLKEILAGIRGVMIYTSSKILSDGVTWNDIDYFHMKTFADLESVLNYADNYQVYHERIESSKGHSIPILHNHFSEIDRKSEDAVYEIKTAKNSTLKSYVYFNMAIHQSSAVEVAKLYHYFTRK